MFCAIAKLVSVLFLSFILEFLVTEFFSEEFLNVELFTLESTKEEFSMAETLVVCS